MTKRPKYRVPSTICWDKAKLSIIEGMNGTVKQLCDKLGIIKPQFSEWKNAILNHIDFEIKKFKNKIHHQKFIPTLNNTFIKTSTWICS